MSRERELLERALDALDGGPLYRLRLKEEIRDYLANANPPEAEPVAFISKNGFRFNADIEPIEHGVEVPLYLHPAPRRPFVRLSEEQIQEIHSDMYDATTGQWADMDYFARAIEDALEERNK